MKEFTYTIKDEQGIHARPASVLAKRRRNMKVPLQSAKGKKQWM